MPRGRLVVFLLILAIAFGNMAWAMDTCAPSVALPEQGTSLTDSVAPDESPVEMGYCSLCHCCSQLVYAGYHTPSAAADSGHLAEIYILSFYHSLRRKPPTQPPRI